MMNGILYSDQIIPANDKIDERLVRAMQGRGHTIAKTGSSDLRPDWLSVADEICPPAIAL